MREFDLIRELRRRIQDPAGVHGIGDDCCTWKPQGETCLSVDAIVEGRHFTAADDPRAVGRKAAAAAVSDLAAAGARPVGAAVALCCPARWDNLAVMEGLIAELDRLGCPLLGGDTTGGEQLTIAVTVWGEPAHGRLLRRSGGRPGDLLAVTGPLGGSLRSGRHLRPEPRLAEGQWLAGNRAVQAMMDLSDGLAGDAPKLATASGCGCLLLPAQVPIHSDVPSMSDGIAAAMGDGEDFELLAAIAADQWPTVQLAWPFAQPLMVVGWLIDQPGVFIEDTQGRVVPMPYTGYEH